MKRIISAVLVVMMLIGCAIPSMIVSAASTEEKLGISTVNGLEQDTVANVSVTLDGTAGSNAYTEFYVYWETSMNVASVEAAFAEGAVESDCAISAIGLASSRNFKTALTPVLGDQISAYSAVKVSVATEDAMVAGAKLADLTFTFSESMQANETFAFKAHIDVAETVEGDELDFAENNEVAGSVKFEKDEYLGIYEETTLFVVPESTEIAPGTVTVKVDVRMDANTVGFWGGMYFLVHPENWEVVDVKLGRVFENPDAAVLWATNRSVVAKLDKNSGVYHKNLADAYLSFPDVPTVGYNCSNILYNDSQDVLSRNTKNGVTATWTFKVPADAKPGDVANFYLTYDDASNGEWMYRLPDTPEGQAVFGHFDLVPVGSTITIKCDHTDTRNETVDATCGTAGSTKVICNTCEAVVSETSIPATGEHDYEDITENATCTTAGSTYKKCKTCGDETTPTTIPALNHDMSLTKTVAPTCKTKGYELWECSRCDYDEKRNEKEPVPHTAGAPVITPATCEEDGLSVTKCSVCGDVMESTPIDALGHDWDDGTVTPPTCDAKGYTTYECGTCHSTKVENYVDSLGHDMKLDESKSSDATCTTAGRKVYVCSHNCGEESVDVLPALGHDWNNGVVTTEPTCTEKGVKTFTCGNCSDTRTEDIAANGHDFGEWTVTKEATVTEEGEMSRTCADCDLVETKAIPKVVYTVVEGANSNWTAGSKADLTIKADGNAEEIASIKVDGEVVDAKNYTIADGKITFKSDYLNGLATGKHTISVVYNDTGVASTEIEVKAAAVDNKPSTDNGNNGNEQKPTSPVTGDNMMYIVIALAVVILAAAAVIVVRRRRENH